MKLFEDILQEIKVISGIDFKMFKTFKKNPECCPECKDECELAEAIRKTQNVAVVKKLVCSRKKELVVGKIVKLPYRYTFVTVKKKNIGLKKYQSVISILEKLIKRENSDIEPILKKLNVKGVSQDLKKKMERIIKELEIFYKVSKLLGSIIDSKELFSLAIDLVPEVMNVENCSLMLIDNNSKTLKIAAAKGISAELIKKIEIQLGEGISGYVAKHGKPVLIDDISKNNQFKRSGSDYKTQSALSVPLKVGTEIIGVINVNNKLYGEKFLSEDVELLAALSGQLANYIEKAELLRKTKSQVNMLTSIHEVGKSISSSLDMDKVLKIIMNEIIKLTSAQKGSIMLLEKGKLRIKASHGLSKKVCSKFMLKLGEGIAGYVAKSAKPMIIIDTKKSKYYLDTLNDKHSDSMLCVPLMFKSKVFGVMSVERPLKAMGAFCYDELEIMNTISAQASIALENARLYQKLLKSYLDTIQSLASAVEAKDTYTHGHSQRVTKYSILIGRELMLSEKKLEMLKHTALLHDIGKIGISESILLKPGGLTNEEFDQIKNHPLLGTKIINSIDFLKEVRNQMKSHHERFDGKGYPDGLIGEEIPLGARIICVADTYDAMTSDRPYRKALSQDIAVSELIKNAGTQFDAKIVNAFLKILGRTETLDGIEKNFEN